MYIWFIRIIVTISFILLWLNCSSQDSPFVFKWHTGNELGVLHYEVQSSTNKINWLFLVSVPAKLKDTNSYAVTLPRNPIYFRVNSLMSGNNSYVTNPVKLDTTFYISNISVTSRTLKFKSDNENNKVSYYSIQQSRYSSVQFIEKQRLISKGIQGDYMSGRFATKYRYCRIVVVFKNGSSKTLSTTVI